MARPMPSRAKRAPRPHFVVRLFRAHWRMLVSVALIVPVNAALAPFLDSATARLIAWDAAVITYLALAYWLVGTADVAFIRKRAETEDEGRILILILVVVAAVVSLLAIIAELGIDPKSASAIPLPARLAFTTVTIFLSWGLIHTVFAFHYAHEFYADDDPRPDGLDFKGDPPDYADFVYFSFVIGMTSQVSDVSIASRGIRHTATMHGILSFFFNASLLALMINIAGSAISPTP